jgi:hypothetical protein
MVELNNHIQSERNDGETSINDNKTRIQTIEIPKFEATKVIESLPQHIETPSLEIETLAKEINTINANVLVKESVTVEVHVNQKVENNIIEESVLEEVVVGNDNLMMVGRF